MRARVWLRRHGRAVVIAFLVLLVVVAAGAFVSWHFSSAVLVPDRSGWPEDVSVEAVGGDRIVFKPDEETTRPGFYGLDWQAGHAIAGPVIAQDAATVTRRLEDLRGYLPAGTKVAFDTDVYSGNPGQARGLPFRTVEVEGDLGEMPAWLVPGHSRTWAIVVHGINGDPQAGLRLAPELHRLDLPTMLITYREDLGAPDSPDDHHHMGLTEWRDLEAAADYAVSQGAGRLVLVGYSMGGSLITQFMQKSPLAERVSALILDAPALDWKSILEFNAEQMDLPGFLATPVEWAIGARIDADWHSLNALDHPEALHLPILLFHGAEDDIVPIKTSAELAEELPRWVTYYRVPRAGHTQSWNVDPHLYERRVSRFLRPIEASENRAKTDRARPRGSGSTS